MSKSASFSIDDAFQESEEDKIRLYSGSQDELHDLKDDIPLRYMCLDRKDIPLLDMSMREDVPLQVMQEEEEFRQTSITIGSVNDVFIAEDKIKIVKKPTLIPQRMKGILSKDDNTSQDSNSLIQGHSNGYYTGPPQDQFWFKHPKIKQNKKMVIAAIVLVILGICLIITSIVIYSIPSLESVQGFIFLIAGIICLLPGGYHLIYIYLAVKGKRGFDFSHLPLFN